MLQEVKVAAKWWTDQLRNTKHDNGEPSHNFLMKMAQKTMKPIPENKIQIFEKRLADQISARIEKFFETYRTFTIMTDYGPDVVLDKAAEYSGFQPDMRFPVKTVMLIQKGEVKVARGYAADFETIWKEGEK